MHFVYLLRCADATLYCGYATNVARRTRAHNGEVSGGARYTAGRRPVCVVYQEQYASRAAALAREAAIKQLSRQQKELLISAACEDEKSQA